MTSDILHDDTFISPESPGPSQSLSGVLLLLSSAVALAWANSPWQSSYHALWHTPVAGWSLQHVVNDGLMALFFLLVGLEIKHELQDGALSSWRKASLPVVGAFGGMVVPAALYATIARGTDATAGWGIPMATDIAFALGIIALLGDRVPAGLRIFLAALAIADDIGAVLVIAVFYTPTVSIGALIAAAMVMGVLLVLNARGVGTTWPYVVLGGALWVAVYLSGIHASIAGVLLSLAIPARGLQNVQDRLEAMLQHPVTYGVVPIFALANAGVTFPAEFGTFLTQPAVVGASLGLILGKPIGIVGASWLAVRFGIAQLPEDADWPRLVGVAILGGIGFTMSLFIATLAFGESTQLDAAKVGVFAGSLITGVGGAAFLSLSGRRSRGRSAAVSTS